MPGVLPAIGDVLQVRFCCYTPTQVGLNILHYQVQTITGVGARVSAMPIAFDTQMQAHYKDLMPVGAKYRGVGVKNITPVATAEIAFTASDGPGASGAAFTATQSSYLVKLASVFAGRGYRGRVYPPFPPESFTNADGSMNAIGKAGLDAWVLALPRTITITDTGGTATLILVILRRLAMGVPLPFPTVVPVNSLNQRYTWATQRRRGELGTKNLPPF